MYGLESADTLNKNFYVDDMLKSVVSVPETVKLVKNVRGMYRAGCFRLTKYVNNNEVPLMSIPQKDRRQPAPDRNFLETIYDIERALGVLWVPWKSNLLLLEDIKVERCFKPKKFGKIRKYSLHHFSNASEFWIWSV